MPSDDLWTLDDDVSWVTEGVKYVNIPRFPDILAYEACMKQYSDTVTVVGKKRNRAAVMDMRDGRCTVW
jgi:hypothetical protein